MECIILVLVADIFVELGKCNSMVEDGVMDRFFDNGHQGIIGTLLGGIAHVVRGENVRWIEDREVLRWWLYCCKLNVR